MRTPFEILDGFIAEQKLSAEEFIWLRSLLTENEHRETVESWLAAKWDAAPESDVQIDFEILRRKIRDYELTAAHRADKPSHLLRRGIAVAASAVAVAAAVVGAVVLSRQPAVITNETVAPIASVDTIRHHTPRGDIRQIVLPDGSGVKLDFDAELRIADDFGADKREVWFDGRGFFEIAPDPSRPFIVHSGGVQYVVKGTSFNLESYPQDSYAVVTLHTGSLLTIVDEEQYLLAPNEALEIDHAEHSLVRRKVEAANSLDWMEGIIRFDKTPLKMVARKLSRHYKVGIEVMPELDNQFYTGRVDNETVDEALLMLTRTSNIRMSIEQSNGKYMMMAGDK